MNDHMTMLIVEDNAAHLADAKKMLERELPLLPITLSVIYATTLEEAESLIERADIVMTDVFFPSTAGCSAEEPNGKNVVEMCLATNTPVVWITSTYHHGSKTNAVSEWGRKRGLEMFDCDAGDGEAEHKPWKAALYGLLYAVVCRELGNPKAMAATGKWHMPRKPEQCADYGKEWAEMLKMGFQVGW